MIRYTSHQFAGCSRSLPPSATEREYSHDAIEITAIRNYWSKSHYFYLHLLTFLRIPSVPLGSPGRAKVRHLSRIAAVNPLSINEIAFPFFGISLRMSQNVSRSRVEVPKFRKIRWCRGARYTGKHTLSHFRQALGALVYHGIQPIYGMDARLV
jgi:hypothetical protein